ncbi:galactose-specific lectin nattectin-like [Pempheris klunzingeri]|uniref:galactose-specific lectin nattectin-like n=1 Tax=Pempheris klunzingeri TaxID=3127111 RepID=UPI0039814FBB
MASGLQYIALLCLTSGLWITANACETHLEHGCKHCPADWTQTGDRCYMFHHSEKVWADAEHFCTTLGGNLASIHTSQEYKHLREMIHRVTGAHKSTWVGGYDAAKEGVWLWSDGSKFDFKGWHKGEPNNHGGSENCMEINLRGRDFVNDAKCSNKKSFICARNP